MNYQLEKYFVDKIKLLFNKKNLYLVVVMMKMTCINGSNGVVSS